MFGEECALGRGVEVAVVLRVNGSCMLGMKKHCVVIDYINGII